jgi:hypothetical protein
MQRYLPWADSHRNFQPILLVSVELRKNYSCSFAAKAALYGGSAEVRIQGAASVAWFLGMTMSPVNRLAS